MRMKIFFDTLIILSSVFLISCEKCPLPELSDIPSKEGSYKPPGKDLPKEITIFGKYTFTENNKSFQFESEKQDWYCYEIAHHIHLSDEDIVPLRFRLYDKNNKLLRAGLPFTYDEERELIKEYPEEIRAETATVWTYIPYHKEGVKIKAVLVDDTGKDVKVLAERDILLDVKVLAEKDLLLPEDFNKKLTLPGCRRQTRDYPGLSYIK